MRGLKVLPAWIAMRPGAPTNLTARVKGVPVDGVAWSVQEGAAGGSVDTAGRYTAPLAPGVYHVIGTNLYDPTKRAVVEVHVSASAGAYVTITPYVTQLGQGARDSSQPRFPTRRTRRSFGPATGAALTRPRASTPRRTPTGTTR